MEEAAHLDVRSLTGTPFQSIQDLLTGDGLQAGYVAEGVDFLHGLVGQFAGDGLVAHAAAVHDGEVHIQTHVVEQIVQSVGAEVAGVGLLSTDQTVAVCVVVIQSDVGVADDLAQLGVDFSDPGILDGLNLGIAGQLVLGNILSGEQVCVGGVIGVGHQDADAAQILAGLGQGNDVAFLVGHFLAHHGGVGVAVNNDVKAGGVGDDFLGGPGLGGGVVAQVGQTNHDVSLGNSGVQSGLDSGVQSGAVLTAGDAVDVVAVSVLEVGGSGLGEGLGGGDTHEGDLQEAQIHELVGIQNGLTGDAVRFMVEVGGGVGELGPLDGVHSAFHAVVKLVVAQSGYVIAGGIHQVDDSLALIHGTVSGALDVVAGIHQNDDGAQAFVISLEGGEVRIADIAVDISVNVVGVEDHDGAFFHNRQTVGSGGDEDNVLSKGGTGHTQNHDQNQEQGE